MTLTHPDNIKFRRKMDFSVDMDTATEEAGHVGVAYALGWDIYGVAANDPAPGFHGLTQCQFPESAYSDHLEETIHRSHRERLQVYLAGKMTVPRYIGKWPPPSLSAASRSREEVGLDDVIAELMDPTYGGFSNREYLELLVATRATLNLQDNFEARLALRRYLCKSWVSGGMADQTEIAEFFNRSAEERLRAVLALAKKDGRDGKRKK